MSTPTVTGRQSVDDSVLRGLIRLARPKQWLKNLLVFAAPGAAGVLDDGRELWLTVVTFAAFCLAASGTYVWNDLFDVDADRAHPTKRRRPIASGLVPVPLARTVGVGLILVSLAVASVTGRWQTVAIVAVYVAITLSYTIWLKHVAVVDLITISSGFVLRAAAGAVAVDVPMSSWFILCITFGSLFIVTGKRYAELAELGDGARVSRATLGAYSLGYLQMVLAVACGAAILTYCIWAFENKDLAGSDLPFYELSIVPVVTAFLRYGLVLDQGHGAAPEEVFASDRVLQLLGLAWIGLYGAAVYL